MAYQFFSEGDPWYAVVDIHSGLPVISTQNLLEAASCLEGQSCHAIGNRKEEAIEEAQERAAEIREEMEREAGVNTCTLASDMVKCEQPERSSVQAVLTTSNL